MKSFVDKGKRIFLFYNYLIVDVKYISARAIKRIVLNSGAQSISAEAVQTLNSLVDELLFKFLCNAVSAEDHLSDISPAVFTGSMKEHLPEELANDATLSAEDVLSKESNRAASGEINWKSLVLCDMREVSGVETSDSSVPTTSARKFLIPYHRTVERIYNHADYILGDSVASFDETGERKEDYVFQPTLIVFVTAVMEYLSEYFLTSIVKNSLDKNKLFIKMEDVSNSLCNDASFSAYYQKTTLKSKLDRAVSKRLSKIYNSATVQAPLATEQVEVKMGLNEKRTIELKSPLALAEPVVAIQESDNTSTKEISSEKNLESISEGITIEGEGKKSPEQLEQLLDNLQERPRVISKKLNVRMEVSPKQRLSHVDSVQTSLSKSLDSLNNRAEVRRQLLSLVEFLKTTSPENPFGTGVKEMESEDSAIEDPLSKSMLQNFMEFFKTTTLEERKEMASTIRRISVTSNGTAEEIVELLEKELSDRQLDKKFRTALIAFLDKGPPEPRSRTQSAAIKFANAVLPRQVNKKTSLLVQPKNPKPEIASKSISKFVETAEKSHTSVHPASPPKKWHARTESGTVDPATLEKLRSERQELLNFFKHTGPESFDNKGRIREKIQSVSSTPELSLDRKVNVFIESPSMKQEENLKDVNTVTRLVSSAETLPLQKEASVDSVKLLQLQPVSNSSSAKDSGELKSETLHGTKKFTALELQDVDDDEFRPKKKRNEESLIDFLRNTEPEELAVKQSPKKMMSKSFASNLGDKLRSYSKSSLGLDIFRTVQKQKNPEDKFFTEKSADSAKITSDTSNFSDSIRPNEDVSLKPAVVQSTMASSPLKKLTSHSAIGGSRVEDDDEDLEAEFLGKKAKKKEESFSEFLSNTSPEMFGMTSNRGSKNVSVKVPADNTKPTVVTISTLQKSSNGNLNFNPLAKLTPLRESPTAEAESLLLPTSNIVVAHSNVALFKDNDGSTTNSQALSNGHSNASINTLDPHMPAIQVTQASLKQDIHAFHSHSNSQTSLVSKRLSKLNNGFHASSTENDLFGDQSKRTSTATLDSLNTVNSSADANYKGFGKDGLLKENLVLRQKFTLLQQINSKLISALKSQKESSAAKIIAQDKSDYIVEGELLEDDELEGEGFESDKNDENTESSQLKRQIQSLEKQLSEQRKLFNLVKQKMELISMENVGLKQKMEALSGRAFEKIQELISEKQSLETEIETLKAQIHLIGHIDEAAATDMDALMGFLDQIDSNPNNAEYTDSQEESSRFAENSISLKDDNELDHLKAETLDEALKVETDGKQSLPDIKISIDDQSV